MKKIIMILVILLILFFFMSCEQNSPVNLNDSVNEYIYVWNGGSIDSLDSITSENFELRINPSFEKWIGRDKLKENILATRAIFPDFQVIEKEIIPLGDTALAVTWIIKGTYKNPGDSSTYGRMTEASGFSIIFHNNEIITGEWIGYSDLTWYKNLGYELALIMKN